MKNRFVLMMALLVAAVLLSYMFTFQVRYDEVAIKTVFDRANERSLVDKPGLHFRLPWPVNDVVKYTRRVQILEDTLRDEQTRDNQVLTTKMYMTWEIADPLAFFGKLKTVENAHKLLAPVLQSESKAAFNQYAFDDLVNGDPDRIRMPEMEQKAAEGVQRRVQDQGYGIRVKHVGLQRLVLPQSNTQAVFDRMVSVRQRMATDAKVSGESQARAIKSQAQKAREQILAFARRRAAAIRAKGLDEAAKYYEVFQREPELAMFLRKIETLRNVNWNNATIMLNAQDLGLQHMFDATKAKSAVALPAPLAGAASPATRTAPAPAAPAAP